MIIARLIVNEGYKTFTGVGLARGVACGNMSDSASSKYTLAEGGWAFLKELQIKWNLFNSFQI